jgi:GYF domain 2
MSQQWFHGRGSDITGPVSRTELTELAASGSVIATDMIWEDGVEDGVPASEVPDLFPAEVAVVAEAKPLAPMGHPDWINPHAQHQTDTKLGRATAGKSTSIMGQDGKTVKFRMKCEVCGRDDASFKTIPIPHGTARASFYCKKCRKRRDCEIHGHF